MKNVRRIALIASTMFLSMIPAYSAADATTYEILCGFANNDYCVKITLPW